MRIPIFTDGPFVTVSFNLFYTEGMVGIQILPMKTSFFLEHFYMNGLELGRGQNGIVRVCTQKLTGENFACKTISKRFLAVRYL